MNAEFEAKVREIAAVLGGNAEPGTPLPPEQGVFLLSLPELDNDAHLELHHFRERGVDHLAINGIFPWFSRRKRDVWPMPYDEVREVAGVHDFVILVPALDMPVGEIVGQIRDVLLPLYLPALLVARVALGCEDRRCERAVDRLVAASGATPRVRGPKRFAAVIGGERRVAMLADVGSSQGVKLSVAGLSVEQAEAVVRMLAGNK